MELKLHFLVLIAGMCTSQTVITGPMDAVVVVGTSTTFACCLEKGEILRISFKFNDEVIYDLQEDKENTYKSKYEVTKSEDAGIFSLTVKNVQLGDAGKYSCAAIDGEKSANLVVLGHPKLTVSPSVLAPDLLVNISCTADWRSPALQSVPPKLKPSLAIVLNGVELQVDDDEELEHSILRKVWTGPIYPDSNGKQLKCLIRAESKVVASVDISLPVFSSAPQLSTPEPTQPTGDSSSFPVWWNIVGLMFAICGPVAIVLVICLQLRKSNHPTSRSDRGSSNETRISPDGQCDIV